MSARSAETWALHMSSKALLDVKPVRCALRHSSSTAGAGSMYGPTDGSGRLRTSSRCRRKLPNASTLGGWGVIHQAGITAAKRKRPAELSAYETYLLGTE